MSGAPGRISSCENEKLKGIFVKRFRLRGVVCLGVFCWRRLGQKVRLDDVVFVKKVKEEMKAQSVSQSVSHWHIAYVVCCGA